MLFKDNENCTIDTCNCKENQVFFKIFISLALCAVTRDTRFCDVDSCLLDFDYIRRTKGLKFPRQMFNLIFSLCDMF